MVSEDPLLFAKRFLGELLSVVSRGSDVIAAVLAVAPVFDVRRLEARCAIVRTLLRVFRRGEESHLYLIEPSNASLDCRSHLLAIAEGLRECSAKNCRIHLVHQAVDGASQGRLSAI